MKQPSEELKLTPPSRPYFAYGSNLDLSQMRERCPSFEAVGKAILPGYRWQINARGFANILPTAVDYVEGVLYKLSARERQSLDVFEAPYSKKLLRLRLTAAK